MVFANVTPVWSWLRSLNRGGAGYHSVRVCTLPSRGAETWCSRSRMLLADELPQAVSVRRRTARAYVLCCLPHVSPAGTVGQEHLANGRLTTNGPAFGLACEVVVRRNVPGSGDARPDQGGIGTGLGKNRRVLSRSCPRHVATTVPAGSTAARSPVVFRRSVHSPAAQQRDHHAAENGHGQ